MNSVPSVYIVNQDPVANTLTKRLLQSVEVFCQDFNSPLDALNNTTYFSPCCFLISFLLPKMSGVELMTKLRRQGIFHPCIFSSPQVDPELIVTAMQAGGFGFVKKPYQTMDFIALIQKALNYDAKVNHYTKTGITYNTRFMCLTMREREVLALILEDLSASKIGQKLGISHRTVENHRNKIFSKLEVSKTSELIRSATIHEMMKNIGLIDI
jgi:FixJ family two-component response regulator